MFLNIFDSSSTHRSIINIYILFVYVSCALGEFGQILNTSQRPRNLHTTIHQISKVAFGLQLVRRNKYWFDIK